MADIEILVDSSQVKTAKQDIQDLGNSFNSAAKSASVYMQAFAKAAAQSARDANYIRDVARANQEVINKNLKVSNSYSSAEASAAAFTEELRKQELQAQKTARANQDAVNKQLGVSGPSAVSGGAGYSAIEAEILRLEVMYNKVAVAAKVYEQAQESLNRAVLMGVLTADQKEAKLAELSIAYQKVGNDASKAQMFINRFGENAQVSGRGLNQFGMYAQQVGYQVGDFLVQIQSGTNFLVAFGQQATQLAGLVPGVLGAALGIGISLATAIGAAFMRSGEAAKESAGGIATYADTIKALSEDIKRAREEFLKLRFDTDSLGVAGAKQQLQEIETSLKALTVVREQLLKAGGGGQVKAGFLGIAELEAEKAALEELLVTLQQIEASQNYLEASRKRASREPSAPYKEEAAYAKLVAEETARSEEHARRKKDFFHAMVGDMGAVSSALFSANSYLESMSPLQREIHDYAQQFSQIDLASGVDAAASAALALAQRLGISLDVAKGMMALGYGAPVVYDPRDPNFDPARASAGRAEQLQKDRFGFSYSTTVQGTKFANDKKGGGGAGAMTTLENRMEEIYKYLEQDKYLIEQETIAYEQRQATLEDALKKKIVSIEEYNQIEKDLKARHEQDLSDIEMTARQQRLQDAGSFFGALASVVGAGGKKTIKAVAAFQAVEGTINAYGAAIKALNDPNISFMGRIAAYASVLAAGLKGVSAIKSAGGIGGGSGGSVGSATVASPSAAGPAPQTVFIDSLDPDGLYSGQALINLFDAFYDENDKRGKVFVVAR